MKRYICVTVVSALCALGVGVMAEGKGSCQQRCARFQKVDTNKDRKLSLEEFKAVCKEQAEEKFKAADTDKDGYLTPKELKAAKGCKKEAEKEKE